QGWLRQEGLLSSIPEIKGWVSPRLSIRFDLTEKGLEIYGLDGQKFLSSIELSQRLEQERLKAEEASLQLEQERLKAERLAEYIRSLGIDPDTL
ncbi:Uma2 family endonuclease, partial [Microcystis aeruginosa CS-555/01A07]|nr:Uma2 family endonuclease [Microcystis aeruginosa CS-555/01A07]